MTENVMLREEIIGMVESAIENEETFVKTFKVNKPKSFAEQLRLKLRERRCEGRVKVMAKSNEVVVVVREPSYIDKLEAMVRRLALHVDDDALYEEAQALVKYI